MADDRFGGVVDPGSYALPDVGPPLIPPGPQFSAGLPTFNRFAAEWGRPEPVPAGQTLYNTKAGPITEGDIGLGMNLGMAFGGGGLSTKPIKAYHSSPHDFSKFDIGKIGTGEGAQAYGHGLYFAENPKVSGQGGEYWNQFMSRFRGPEAIAAGKLQGSGFDRASAEASAQQYLKGKLAELESLRQHEGKGYYKERQWAFEQDMAQQHREIQNARDAAAMLASGKPVGPRTYEVGIHADPQAFLNWDAPMTQQPQVQKNIPGTALDSSTGQNIYNDLVRLSGGRKTAATDFLLERGIPGIRYLDQHSRQAVSNVASAERNLRLADPAAVRARQAELEAARQSAAKATHNYVVFDPSIVEIMKKYGIVGAPLGALAAQDQYQLPE